MTEHEHAPEPDAGEVEALARLTLPAAFKSRIDMRPMAFDAARLRARVAALEAALRETLAFARALEKHSGRGTGGRRGGAIIARADAALAAPRPAKDGEHG